MSDSVKKSLIWAGCIVAVALCFLLSDIFGKPAARRTALQECAWDRTNTGSVFCVELAKSGAREPQP